MKEKKENIFVRFLKYLFPWRGDSAREVVRKIVFLISVAALIVSGTYFGIRFAHRNDYNKLPEISSEVDWDDEEKKDDGTFGKYDKLLATNPDFCGWLKIDSTPVDVPLVQTKDNEKYLKTSFYGEYSEYGNPFVDFRNKLDKDDRNIVIYGHNMKDDMVFARLLEYKNLSFYKEHPVIYLGTLYDDSYWKIVSVFITNAGKAQDNGYFFEYNFINCQSENFEQYAEELKKRSLIDTGVDINSSDRLLTLSTCQYDIEDGRFVVVARKLRSGESAKTDTSAAKLNPNPKFPQAYCAAKGIKNIYAEDKKWQPYD